MGDENQPSKKRAAGRELSRDNPGLDDEEDVGEQEMGTFKKASDDVLATRRIVKVRRQTTSTTPSAPSSNPFAGIRLVPPAPSATPVNVPVAAAVNAAAEVQAREGIVAGEDSETKDDATTETEVKNVVTEEKPVEVAAESVANEESSTPANQDHEVNHPGQAALGVVESAADTKLVDEKDAVGSAEKSAESDPAGEKQAESVKGEDSDKNENGKTGDSSDAPLNSFQQLSSTQNAFTGLTGSGFSGSAFSFGSFQKDGSPSQSSLPSFGFSTSNNGGTALFGTSGTSIGSKTESAFGSMPEAPRETGEENEETVFSADSVLFEFFDGGWKERGKGEVKVNVLKGETQKARLVMRAKGNLRLILNASVYADMKLTKMDKKGITFACVNIANEGKSNLSTFALKFKDVSIVEDFSSAVYAHKDKPVAALKMPENSPKAEP